MVPSFNLRTPQCIFLQIVIFLISCKLNKLNQKKRVSCTKICLTIQKHLSEHRVIHWYCDFKASFIIFQLFTSFNYFYSSGSIMLQRGVKFSRSLISTAISPRLHSTLAQPKISLGKDQKFTPGNVYCGFMCKRVEFIPHFNMTAMIFEHEKTGLQYVHVDRNDSNNVFSINFRTTVRFKIICLANLNFNSYLSSLSIRRDFHIFLNTAFYVDRKSSPFGIRFSKCWIDRSQLSWMQWLDPITHSTHSHRPTRTIIETCNQFIWTLFFGPT